MLSIAVLVFTGCLLYCLRIIRRLRGDERLTVRMGIEEAVDLLRSMAILLGIFLFVSLSSWGLLILSYMNPSLAMGESIGRLMMGITGLSVLSVPILLRIQRRLIDVFSHDAKREWLNKATADAGNLPSTEGEEIPTTGSAGEIRDRFRILSDRIRDTMEERKPYLDPDFTLDDLARLMGVPKHHIYHCLNGTLNVRFTRMRAEYRIRHAIRLIDEGAGSGKSLQTIGLESGFSSRSSFIIAFCEVTGQTPRDYLRGRSETAS